MTGDGVNDAPARVAVQLATVIVPGLRTVLGLHTLDAAAYGYIVAALAVSVVGAYVSARLTGESN